MTDVYSKAKRSEIMSRVRNKKTTPEDKVAQILRQLGIAYRRNLKTLPGKPDFVIYRRRTVLFVNGCFWHGHENCKRAHLPDTNRDFWAVKIAKNKRRDAKIQRMLRREGWHVWILWQCRLRRPAQIRRRLIPLLLVDG